MKTLKRIFQVLIIFICASCNFETGDPELVEFVFENTDKTVFKEVKVVAFSRRNGLLAAVDSINHYPLKSPGIPYHSSIGIGFFVEKIDSIQNGIFEAVAVREDSTVFRSVIGEINGSLTKRDFIIQMSNRGISPK